MQRIPKQTQYVRCPVLELSCNSLCGPQAKTFGDPVVGSRDHPKQRMNSTTL